jgi:hypothetical protein
MKKTLLFTTVLLALTVSVAAAAGGFNLTWGSICYTESPVPSLVFACATNTGTAGILTTSFAIDAEMTDLVGIEWAIDGQSDTPTLPDWWQVSIAPSADCRAGKATFNSNYTAVESATCVDWTAGAGFNAPNYTWTGNRVHITLGTAIDASGPYDAVAGQEYYSGGVTILNSKTVGTGACTGCSTGMVFAQNHFTAAGLAGRRDDFETTLTGGNQCLSWNNASTLCEIVPVRATTWGQIKSLYR